jgi:hypothetical protein
MAKAKTTKVSHGFKILNVKNIKPQKYNPKKRGQDSRFKQLERSIGKLGLQYPLLVNKNDELIDGHRRLQAMKNLGIDEIPCIISANTDPVEEIYADINHTACQLSGNQNLSVWLKQPLAVTPRQRTIFENAQIKFGRTILKKIENQGASVNLLRACQEIANYVDKPDDNAFLRQIADWLLRYKNTRMIRSYCQMQLPANVLIRQIKANKPIKPVYK